MSKVDNFGMQAPIAMNVPPPTFSIITVVYNDPAGLALTRDSLASQSFKNFEWIVIDGNSTDTTLVGLKNTSIKNMLLVSEPDHGIYDAMNKGIKRCSGNFLTFLNAGDFFPHSNTLADVNDAIYSANVNINILFGGTEYIFPDSWSIYRPPKTLESSIWHGLPANHQATYFSKEVMRDIVYDLKYKICGDYYLIATLSKKNLRPGYVNKAIVKFEVGGTSYNNRGLLLLEPYLIQRDILMKPFWLRVASLFKRCLSTLLMASLLAIHKKRNA